MNLPPKTWALTGAEGRKPNLLKSLYLQDGALSDHNWKLFQKYEKMKKEEVRFETFQTEDARLIITAFGSIARISKTSVELAREEGMKVGLFRPITLFPFPETSIRQLSNEVKRFLTVELNTGQMVEDVRLSVDRDAMSSSMEDRRGLSPRRKISWKKLRNITSELDLPVRCSDLRDEWQRLRHSNFGI